MHFSEGRLTAEGEIGEFRAGLVRIVKATPVPLVPMPAALLTEIRLMVGSPIAPERAGLQRLGSPPCAALTAEPR